MKLKLVLIMGVDEIKEKDIDSLQQRLNNRLSEECWFDLIQIEDDVSYILVDSEGKFPDVEFEYPHVEIKVT